MLESGHGILHTRHWLRSSSGKSAAAKESRAVRGRSIESFILIDCLKAMEYVGRGPQTGRAFYMKVSSKLTFLDDTQVICGMISQECRPWKLVRTEENCPR